jgi:hypothetical protein
MTPRILENSPAWLFDWSLVAIMGDTPPPRDPNDDDDDDDDDAEDEDDEQNDDREPAVIREPDEDE